MLAKFAESRSCTASTALPSFTLPENEQDTLGLVGVLAVLLDETPGSRKVHLELAPGKAEGGLL